MGTTYEGRTLTLHWDDHEVVGRWSDGAELDPVPVERTDDRVQWLVDLIGRYRRAYPGARVRATNRDGWLEPVRGTLRYVVPQARRTPAAYVVKSPLEPLHYHVIPEQQQVKECWHRCSDVN